MIQRPRVRLSRLPMNTIVRTLADVMAVRRFVRDGGREGKAVPTLTSHPRRL